MEILQLLFFALALIGFMVFNYAMQRAARRAQARQQQEALQQDTVDTAQNEPLDDVWGRTPQSDLVTELERPDLIHRTVPLSVQSATDSRRTVAVTQGDGSPRSSRIHGRDLFRSRQALRHAIVSMTVLGPCRALEPYAARSDGASIAP